MNVGRCVRVCAAVVWSIAANSGAEEPRQLQSSDIAQTFGSAPTLWGARLSPDGSKLSAIQMHADGVTMVRVFSFDGDPTTLVLAGKRDEFDVRWCDWVNDQQLLCGLIALRRMPSALGPQYFPHTRLISASADGKVVKVLLEEMLENPFYVVLSQDHVVDWLPDDPDHVLVAVPGDKGANVYRLNVYDGKLFETDERTSAHAWLTDGHGTPRLYGRMGTKFRRWHLRDTPGSEWSLLHETDITDLRDQFSPIGFGADRNELLFFDAHEGRRALFAFDLAHERKRRLVYAHPEFDVADVQFLGKYNRVVAASYVDTRSHLHFFDARVQSVHESIEETFPERTVAILDESWDQRYYLVFVNSATDAGTYYRFDARDKTLAMIADVYPELAARKLAPVTAVRYPAVDGTPIPAYLTAQERRSGPGPAVILPHGGPSARDYETFDYLAQFLAAAGYVVLQSNYRGSGGYGVEWLGEGGFRGWRRAVGDITDGARYLISQGIADPERICAVGWSYGGYAALMSTIEHPDMYRCAVSIAGVSDPGALARSTLNFIGGLESQAFIGRGDEVREHGSPLARVHEIKVPVLLVHGAKDINVPMKQSEVLHRALGRAGRDSELIEYDHAEHSITPERYRIDLLARLAAFLEKHTARRQPAGESAATR
jgi:dipeptidyl aminopeptidase/acylaminoacyl peptidase